jgi:hypothetical protein
MVQTGSAKRPPSARDADEYGDRKEECDPRKEPQLVEIRRGAVFGQRLRNCGKKQRYSAPRARHKRQAKPHDQSGPHQI